MRTQATNSLLRRRCRSIRPRALPYFHLKRRPQSVHGGWVTNANHVESGNIRIKQSKKTRSKRFSSSTTEMVRERASERKSDGKDGRIDLSILAARARAIDERGNEEPSERVSVLVERAPRHFDATFRLTGGRVKQRYDVRNFFCSNAPPNRQSFQPLVIWTPLWL